MNHWNRRHDYYEKLYCPKCANARTKINRENKRYYCDCGWKETDEDVILYGQYHSNKEVSSSGHHKERKVANDEQPVDRPVAPSVDVTVEDILSETAKTFKRFGARDPNKYLS